MWRFVSIFILSILSWNLVGSMIPLVEQKNIAAASAIVASGSDSGSQITPTLNSENEPCDPLNCDNEECQFHVCHFGHRGYVVNLAGLPRVTIKVASRVFQKNTILSSVVLPGLLKPPSVS